MEYLDLQRRGIRPSLNFRLDKAASVNEKSVDASRYLLRLVRHFQQARETARRRIYLFTSQWPDEGKTSLIVELSQTLAGSGRRVLLVDGDRRRPTLSRHFNCSGPGLGALESSEGAFAENRGEGLDVVGTGVASRVALHVMPGAIERFRQTASQYDLVLVDSPPLSAGGDALVLASLCDAAILVSSAQAYRGAAEVVSVRDLERQGIPVEGVILTQHEESGGGLPAAWLERLLVWSGLKP